MNQEDNVCGETTLTEEVSSEKVGVKEMQPKKDSAVLGKFKDVDALAQAYNALQAEFTRRSQRLKELERERENLKAKKEGAESLGVEKLRKNAMARKADRKRFDAFMADVFAEQQHAERPVPATEQRESDGDLLTEDAENMGAEMQTQVHEEAPQQLSMDTLGEKGVENLQGKEVLSVEVESPTAGNGKMTQSAQLLEMDAALGEEKKTSESVANSGVAVPLSEGLYEKVLEDEQVRLRIIGEYLASIGRSGAPVTLQNTGILAAPPMRAKSIADAGGMALHYFKTEK